MLHNNMFNTLNQIFNICSLTPSNFVGEASTTFSSFTLLSLLLVSLGLTFHTKGTTVHKVLGLLLTSIFVVFLWMLQSQFLFIYVVYILAFISAVLMLFLSVVLMLPISTLAAKNTMTDQKNNHKAYFFVSVISQDFTTVSTASTMVLMVLTMTIFFIKFTRNFSASKLYNDLIEYSKYRFQIVNQISSNNFFNKISKQPKFNVPQIKPVLIFTNDLRQNILKVGNAGWKRTLELQHEQLNNLNIKYSLILGLTLSGTIFELVLLMLNNSILTALATLKYNTRVTIQAFKVVSSAPHTVTKVLWDIAAQTYLFAVVLLSMVSLFLSKQTLLEINTNALNIEASQGLGQIKELLYGEFSLFLLFSTLVLLIALLGAAVMTRSKR